MISAGLRDGTDFLSAGGHPLSYFGSASLHHTFSVKGNTFSRKHSMVHSIYLQERRICLCNLADTYSPEHNLSTSKSIRKTNMKDDVRYNIFAKQFF